MAMLPEASHFDRGSKDSMKSYLLTKPYNHELFLIIPVSIEK